VKRVVSYYEMEAENHLMIVRNSEEKLEDDVIGTIAVFMNREPVSTTKGDRAFNRLIDIRKGDKTVKEVLVKEGVGYALEGQNLTFKVPPELAVEDVHGLGYPLLTKKVSEGGTLAQGSTLIYTVIGFVIPIDKKLTTALKTLDINCFWAEAGGVVWCAKDTEDFSSYLQALCEDHQIDPPVPLE